MTPTEQKAFDAMRQALDTIIQYNRDHARDQYGDAEKAERWACVVKAREALTAVASVSHPKPETAPAPEGGAITSESAANAVSAKALITVESSLRFRLECEQQKSADLLDEVRELKGKLIKARQPQAQGEAVYLVATGETHNGEETYCRYDYPPALSEFERLYTHPQATEPAVWKLVPVEPTQEMLDAVVTTLDDHLLGPDAEKQYREDWAAMLAAAPEAKQ